jgi:hypothetical protein
MVQKPIAVLPRVWMFALNALLQLLQNLKVKLAINGLTRRYEFLGLEGDQHGLDIAANLVRFFLATVNLATSTATAA